MYDKLRIELMFYTPIEKAAANSIYISRKTQNRAFVALLEDSV
jgi:hypothetical protein